MIQAPGQLGTWPSAPARPDHRALALEGEADLTDTQPKARPCPARPVRFHLMGFKPADVCPGGCVTSAPPLAASDPVCLPLLCPGLDPVSVRWTPHADITNSSNRKATEEGSCSHKTCCCWGTQVKIICPPRPMGSHQLGPLWTLAEGEREPLAWRPAP